MVVFCEGRLKFSFPGPSQSGISMGAAQYDKWSFYRNQFTNMFGQSKAVDFLYVEREQTWLIEVKDYRLSVKPRTLSAGM